MSDNPDDVGAQVRAFLEARKHRPKSIQVVDELERVLWTGREHIEAWAELYRIFYNGDRELFALAGWFFTVSAVAHLHAATLHAATLVEDHRDSINVLYLLNLMDGLRGDASKKSNIRQSVRSGRERLATIRSEIALIKEYRDQRLAHVDRIRVNRGLDEGSAVAVTTLRTVFECVGEVVAQQRLVLEGPERTASHNDLLGQIMEPRGLSDLLYFARIAVADVNIQDPSIHAQRLRSLERSLREVEVDLRSADPRMP